MRFEQVLPTHPFAAPLLDDLRREYDERYADLFRDTGGVREMDLYPPEAFAPPHGCFLLLMDGDEPVSGGAFMRSDESTAEFKRIWTSTAHRGRGLAGRVLRELEVRAGGQGYSRVVLTTGPRQPEAVALYLRHDYVPQYDTTLPPEAVGLHSFAKDLPAAGAAQPTVTAESAAG